MKVVASDACGFGLTGTLTAMLCALVALLFLLAKL
jgi:hypothetical protein